MPPASPQDTTQGEQAATQRPDLVVPVLQPGMSVLDAARAYSLGGFYVAPVHPAIPNHAGRFLGRGWPEKTSRNFKRLDYWLTPYNLDGADCPQPGIALHVGRSGAIAFDVDNPDCMPQLLRDAIEEHNPPYQATRANLSGRGHYLFALPDGVMFGNSKGRLRGEWGDVRGHNGIIVVQPTPHRKEGGRYEWLRTGTLPELPAELVRALTRPRRAGGEADVQHRQAYIRRTIGGVLRAVADADNGHQNKLLYWGSCRLGEMVQQSLITRGQAEQLLLDTARTLPEFDSSRPWSDDDFVGTIRSGIERGMSG